MPDLSKLELVGLTKKIHSIRGGVYLYIYWGLRANLNPDGISIK